jgi:hypothetical protein
MGVQPTTLQPGLIAAQASADTVAPTSQMTEPAANATVAIGSSITVRGTASDGGNGRVAAVEVSTDGGATWHPAVGRNAWSYTWFAVQSGSATLKCRAVDDSANLQSVPAGVTVTVGTPSTTPNPVPANLSLSPTSAVVGTQGLTLTVMGTGFTPSSVVLWNGSARSTVFASATQVSASILASDLASRAFVPVTVRNPTPGGGTASPRTFTVRLVPAITSLSPPSAFTGTGPLSLTVNGNNFGSDAVVRWNGADRPTTFFNATQLSAAVSTNDLAVAGTATVYVFNPSPGGNSNTYSFRINQPPSSSMSRFGGPLSVNVAPGSVRVFPSPWRVDRHEGTPLTWDGLAPGSKINIFTISGHWVKAVEAPSGVAVWDLTNDDGQPVASGYYLYVVKQGTASDKQGKFAVIR